MKKKKKLSHIGLYVMLILPIVYLIIFKYWPIYGGICRKRKVNAECVSLPHE